MRTDRLEPYATRSNFPYLFGVYLAANAIPDAALVVDGPDCALYKAQFIQGRHDLNSTLIDCGGRSRLLVSCVTVEGIVKDRTAALDRLFLEAATGRSVVLAASLPMAAITGTQYGQILRRMTQASGVPGVEIPFGSLGGDWLDGYSATLEALARAVGPGPGGTSPRKVGIVGYFMDRNENDHFANVAELERLIRALDLEPVSTWLSGRPWSHLQAIREAGVIVALPHGVEAARMLADRTGARVVELPVPIGPSGTMRWLSDLGAATGREEAAERVLADELNDLVPRIRWLVQQVFCGVRVSFVGDPHLIDPVVGFLEELGCVPVLLASVGRGKRASVSTLPVPVLVEPTAAELRAALEALPEDRRIDLAIQCDTYGFGGDGEHAVLPFGFATPLWHAVADAPFVGFRGAACLVHRMAEKLMERVRRAR
jgi:nitrogenase molybdenum-iron protein alpha/beta subunit